MLNSCFRQISASLLLLCCAVSVAAQPRTPARNTPLARSAKASATPELPPSEARAGPARAAPTPKPASTMSVSRVDVKHMNVPSGQGLSWRDLVPAFLGILGVLLGVLVAHFAAVRLKKMDRMVDYEIQNQKQVYGPLYKELQALSRGIDENPYIWFIDTGAKAPTSTENVLGEFRHWSRVSEDERRLRVPTDLRDILDGLLSLIGSYNDLRQSCVPIIDAHVRKLLFELSGKDTRLRNLGEAVADEILADQMKGKRSVFAEQCSTLGIGDTAAAFERACAVRQAPEVSATIDAASKLRARIESVSNELRNRIERILARYGRGGSRV